jgi:hypothetical protein
MDTESTERIAESREGAMAENKKGPAAGSYGAPQGTNSTNAITANNAIVANNKSSAKLLGQGLQDNLGSLARIADCLD